MDSTPGLEVYESYETDYKTLAASIGDKLKGEARESKGGERVYPTQYQSSQVNNKTDL